MKKAYIILAHKNAQQLKRLIEQLDEENAMFFLHIDKRTSFNEFKNELKQFERLVFVERVSSEWAGFGLIEAVLNSIKQISSFNIPFERVILLSAQDYPIKSKDYINDFFRKSSFTNFIDYYKIPNEKWKPNGGLYRVNKYYIGTKKYQKYLAKSLNFLSMFFFPVKRRLPLQTETPFAGSQWWIFDQNAINYIISFLEENPGYIKFHRYTFAPDEVFFQMILLNTKDEKLLSSISRDNKRFYKWCDANNAHPDILGEEDFKAIEKSDALFARKFDVAIDKVILDIIDKRLLQNN